MKNLAFIGNGEPPAKLLEIFRKQTPGSKGEWGQLRGVDNYQSADYFMVIDDLPGNLKVDIRKCVFLGTHPETLRAYRNTAHYKNCLARTDCKDYVGMLEWWIDYDYDYLKALQPPTKKNLLGAIVSNSETDKSHIMRKDWLKRFTSRDNLDFNLHGRIQPSPQTMARYYRGACGSLDPRGAAATGGANNHMIGKEQVYLNHKYMLEFDNIGKSYFSERILDCMLLWAMPIYWGGNLHSYLPADSFRYLDIGGDGQDVLNLVNSGFYEQHLGDLARAREILLDELQLWPRTHKLIFNTFK